MPVAKYPCNNPHGLIAGADTGFEACDTGFVHRPVARTCPSRAARATACFSGGPDGGGMCATDSDCTAHPNGFCSSVAPGGGGPTFGCQCYYGCASDADCGAGNVCLCGDPVGQCVSASCKTDADCGPGLLCTMSAPPGTCPSGAPFACQTAADSCGGGGDCSTTPGALSVCSYTGSVHQCEAGCVFGRPFLVRGAAQTAGLVRRADWLASVGDPNMDGLGAREREALATAWARMAAMEHASIAAFARFALQLLSVGAPASLLEQTHEAMRDETEHAKMCFALASRYAGRAIGPDSLSVGDALVDLGREAILVTTILEGCIGETVAAVEAAEALAHTKDPSILLVLTKIADDEKRHAELAWRFVRWAVAQDEDLRAAAARVFAHAASDAASRARPEGADSGGPLLAFGVLSEDLRREIRTRVLLDVVAPCAKALLSAPAVTPDATVAHERTTAEGTRAA